MKTECVCLKCGTKWESIATGHPESSPGICASCGNFSAKIVVEKS